MDYILLSSLLFSTLTALVAGSPTSLLPTSASSPPSNHQPFSALATVKVDCPDKASYDQFMRCYQDNAAHNCGSKDGPDRTICMQLWQIMCGQDAGCHVSET
ncbi:hypothetical protein AAE478_004924 [Parahypoxylon ruwenzoriense]